MSRAAARVALAAVLLLLGAPLHAQESRANPCALAELEGGIGGTGILARDGGIGGTGIVGTVTGFGSICVNGVEVLYDASVPITWNGLPAAVSELALGQVVAAEVLGTAQGLQAQSLAILAAVAGPVAAIEEGALTVLGVRVLAGPRALVLDDAGRPIALSELRPGDAVVVSGLRRPDDSIVASRIERSASLRRESRAPTPEFSPRVTRLLLEGYLERYAEGDSLSVLGRTISLSPGTVLSGPAPGAGLKVFVLARVGARGEWRAERVLVPRSGLATPLPQRELPALRSPEPPREIRIQPRIEPRFEPRLPAPAPGAPGRR